MPITILIDQSHNEKIRRFPDQLFNSPEFDVHINGSGEVLIDDEQLSLYDLVIMGHPRPRKLDERLFKIEEIRSLHRYLHQGGNLLITSGSKGDYGIPLSSGSLRLLHKVTGVLSFHAGDLFHNDPDHYLGSKTNLAIDNFPQHPIFDHFTEDDELFLGKSTGLVLDPDSSGEIVLHSVPHTYLRMQHNKKMVDVNEIPLMISKSLGHGKVLSCGFSDFLTENTNSGFTSDGGGKLLAGILSWLIDQKVE